MTNAFTQTHTASRLPTLPGGWPISSFDTYKQAQQAVFHLAGNDFPLEGVAIVDVDPCSSSGSTPT